ncbi:integral membrane protein [Fusarium sp. NRRL 25303]|nr:integral membrane protein [Fusarium sp. NRRL 25303]
MQSPTGLVDLDNGKRLFSTIQTGRAGVLGKLNVRFSGLLSRRISSHHSLETFNAFEEEADTQSRSRYGSGGRNIWSTKKGSGKHHYEDYSKKSGQQQARIELQDKPRKKVDTYGFTIQGKEGSEENMVDVDKVSNTTSSRPESPKDGIARTDLITIDYDGGEGGLTSEAKRWAAV